MGVDMELGPNVWNERGEAQENGVAEKADDLLDTALEQTLDLPRQPGLPDRRRLLRICKDGCRRALP